MELLENIRFYENEEVENSIVIRVIVNEANKEICPSVEDFISKLYEFIDANNINSNDNELSVMEIADEDWDFDFGNNKKLSKELLDLCETFHDIIDSEIEEYYESENEEDDEYEY